MGKLHHDGCTVVVDPLGELLQIRNHFVGAEVELTISRQGVGHGLAVWFDMETEQGVGFSNAPGETDLIYGRAFFPWSQPVALAEGDEPHHARLADGHGGTVINIGKESSCSASRADLMN